MLDEIASKLCIKAKVIDKGKKSMTLNEVKSLENLNRNPQSLLEINPVQQEVLPSHKLQNHAYE